MELGEKLRLARQEAGLSQRQPCGEKITRNMLSQIEHGTAKPSMETLRYLAARLERPVSFFLEEDGAVSPNQTLMIQAREKWLSGDAAGTWLLLKAFKHPDPVLEWEWNSLSFLSALEAAKAACREGKLLYARQLLEAAESFRTWTGEPERQRLLLLAEIPGTDLSGLVRKLPSLDAELLIRGEAALAEEDPARAQALLDSVQDRDSGKWNLLQGRLLMQRGEFRRAAEHLQQAEPEFGTACVPLLEICFRELKEFQKAYEYACRQRTL